MTESILKNIPVTIHPSDNTHCSTYCNFLIIRADKSVYCSLFGALLQSPNHTHGNMNQYRTPVCIETFNS